MTRLQSIACAGSAPLVVGEGLARVYATLYGGCMTERICYICKKPAAGYASIWTAKDGERWYCHGDDDEYPTCYERAPWPQDALGLDEGRRTFEGVSE